MLTNENYYAPKSNMRYMSVSQYKSFIRCESAAMAELQGEWVRPKTTALLVGSYVDAYFEGTLDEFRQDNPAIFKRDGSLKADYVKAEEVIVRIEADPMFLEYMSGEKQVIRIAELFGCEWKIKVDSYLPDRIVDLKVMRSMERIIGKSFVEHWGYDNQMAVYGEIDHRAGAPVKETYLAVATKQDPPDLEVIHIPMWRREECLNDIQRNLPRILAVKAGKTPPRRCGVCEYCRKTKKLVEPLDFELVGFSQKELDAMRGVG